jgi:hypothetical protein
MPSSSSGPVPPADWAAPPSYPPPVNTMPPAPPAPPRLPWEERRQLGFGAALIQSVQLFASRPREAFDRAARKGDYASPVLWMAVFVTLAIIFQVIWSFALAGPMTAFMTAFMPESMRDEFAASMAASMGLNMVMNIVMIPIILCFTLVASFIMAGIYHLCLMLAGGSGSSESGFEGTFRAVGYSAVAQGANIVPFIGPLIAFIWGLVLLVVGMSSMHRISNGKAFIVVLIPVFLCCACIAIGLAFGAAGMIGAMGNR